MDRNISSSTVISSYISHSTRKSEFIPLQILLLAFLLILIAIAVPVVAADRPATATETTLYSFTGGNDGGFPAGALIWDSAGNLYGTTMAGGSYNEGTVFKLTPGSGGWTESVLYTFTGGNDGGYPFCKLVFDTSGNLYGTTLQGGAPGWGVVFKLTPSQGNWSENVLYTFTGGNDGGMPSAGVILDANGNVYGTASRGGQYGGGVIFELTSSSDGWTETVLHALGNSTDGSDPEAGLTFDRLGNLFGTTYSGGVYGDGTVFKLHYTGTSWAETVAYSFTGGNDGANPRGGILIGPGGVLFGTTYAGGTDGSGVLYEMLPVSALNWTQAVIHQFSGYSGGEDGDRPRGDLAIDSHGDIYGNASRDGAGSWGTVFECRPASVFGWQFVLLYAFTGGTDGLEPVGGPILDSSGNLYGTAYFGGAYDYGDVYEVVP
jgi:uncharacterized repeat protein (TIGR03803 family)